MLHKRLIKMRLHLLTFTVATFLVIGVSAGVWFGLGSKKRKKNRKFTNKRAVTIRGLYLIQIFGAKLTRQHFTSMSNFQMLLIKVVSSRIQIITKRWWRLCSSYISYPGAPITIITSLRRLEEGPLFSRMLQLT